MSQAMETMKQFSEMERARDLYKRRLDFIREQKAIQWTLDRYAREKEEERRRAEEAEKEKERLLRLLRKAGIDPETT